MVPENAGEEWLEGVLDGFSRSLAGLPLLARGAESELRLGSYFGIPAVFKYRRPKPYMDPALDSRLRRHRTLREARVIIEARRAGVRAPRILAVFPWMHVLVMEYIEGPRLKESISAAQDPCALSREAGGLLGLLHKAGIAHGDPTTSNFIVSSRGLYIIDFGLSDFSRSTEDFAVDIHLFRRAVEATHASLASALYECFVQGYSAAAGDLAREVLDRAEEIRLRGRYVEERRRSVWGQ